MKKNAGNIKPIAVNTSRRKKSPKIPGVVKATSAFKLKKSQQQQDEFDNNNLKALINNTTDLIWSVDKKLRLITSNNAFDEAVRLISGNSIKPGDEVLGKGFNEEVLSYWKRTYAKVFTGETFTEIISPNSLSGRWLEYSFYPIRKRNEIIGAACYSRDITERKKIEEALRESEKRFRQIIDLVPHFIFAKDAKGKFILANQAVATAYGSTIEDLIGKSDVDFNSNKEEVEHFVQEDLEVINSGISKYGIEETVTDATGKLRILSTTKIPFWYSGTDIPGVLGVSVDISEHKKAETVLKENAGQLSIATQIAKLGYWEMNIAEGIFTFNDQFYAILKTSAEKMGGYKMPASRYTELFLHPDDRDIVKDEVVKAIETTDPDYSRHIEHRIIYPNGEIGYLAVRFFVVKDDQGRTIRTVGANQDITELKKNEIAITELNNQLNKRAEELAISNAELERFAYVASHDLQEPLRMVSSFLQLLQKKYKGEIDNTADQYIEFAVDGAERMKRLILDLLEYSRVGTNKDVLVATDISDVVSQVLKNLGDKIAESGAVTKVHLMPVIKANKTQMIQLFQNLVSNALKYNTSFVPEIEIGYEDLGSAWQFFVKDNGIGIEKRFFEKVFIIFQRLHNKNQFSGTGIGLAICKKIVERHNGMIWLESVEKKGSSFFFTVKK